MQAAGGGFGSVLGQAGLTRFERDVLAQSGTKYVIVGLGINDIAFPGSLTSATEGIKVQSIIAAYRQLIMRAHQGEFESSARRTHRSGFPSGGHGESDESRFTVSLRG